MTGGSGGRVLVVGSGDAAAAIAADLSDAGFGTVRAESAPVGLATLDDRDVDCLLVTDSVDAPADAFAVARRRGYCDAGVYVGSEVVDLPSGVDTVTAADAVGAVRRSLLDEAAEAADPVESADPLSTYGATVAHELRNHVEAATLALEADQPERVEDALERLDDLAREAEAVASGSVSRTSSVPVDEPATAAVDRVRTPILDVDVDVDRAVEADRALLTLLFENCYRNSVEHGATVDREALAEADPDVDDVAELFSNGDGETGGDPTQQERSVQVTVTDTPEGFAIVDDGPGFETDRPFAWGETTGNGRGTGLAVVRRIAEAHGWTVAASSDDGARIDVHV